MKPLSRISMICSFVLFIVLCASSTYWVMQFMQSKPRKVSAPPVQKPVADIQTVASLFGGALAFNANYQLNGIVLANPRSQSEAIIAVDGKPSEAYTVKSEIRPGIQLAEVHAGYILILDNGVHKRVELPLTAKPTQQGGINDARSAILARMPQIPRMPGSVPGMPPPMNTGNANLPDPRNR